jgi:predicted dehydrogenase
MGFRAAIAGAGNIGSAFDHGERVPLPRTHTGALLAESSFALVGVSDPDRARREAFTRDWVNPCPVFEDLSGLLSVAAPELLVVASPTSTHLDLVKLALEHPCRPRLIFCEKPFGENPVKAADLVGRAREVGTILAVNYHRRWDAKMARLRDVMLRLGTPEHVQVVYRKGLYNYGSHVVDLLLYCFGAVDAVRPLGPRGGPSHSAELGFQSGFRAQVIGVEGAQYELFDGDFFFREAKFSVEFGGQRVREFRPRDGVYFPGYRSLIEVPDAFPVGPVHGLVPAYQEFARILGGQAQPVTCSGEDAVATLKILDAIAQGPE